MVSVVPTSRETCGRWIPPIDRSACGSQTGGGGGGSVRSAIARQMLATALQLCLAAVAASSVIANSTALPINRFGMGVYNDTAAPDIALQLPEAAALVGDDGTVLLFFEITFAHSGDPGSCMDGCLPAGWQAAAVRQAYALNLRPVVRLGQVNLPSFCPTCSTISFMLLF